MFNKTKTSFMTKNHDIDTGSINLIGVGTSIGGEIKSNGDVRIDRGDQYDGVITI
jgi:cytoskeletal protein CcmA (bactofilin family)